MKTSVMLFDDEKAPCGLVDIYDNGNIQFYSYPELIKYKPKPKPKPPQQYRLLTEGETIKNGDEFLAIGDGWKLSKNAGCIYEKDHYHVMRRPIQSFTDSE